MLILVAVGGAWFGYRMRTLRTTNYSVSVDGYGEFPQKAFMIVNNELNGKIENLLGDFASQDNVVVVTPRVSGYDVRFTGLSGSKLWDEGVQHELHGMDFPANASKLEKMGRIAEVVAR